MVGFLKIPVDNCPEKMECQSIGLDRLVTVQGAIRSLKGTQSPNGDAKVQLVNSGPPRCQHHDKDRGASVTPKI